MSAPTRLEAGHGHVLAYCADCPPWRRLAGDRPEAMRVAAVHLELVHDDHQRARNLRAEANRVERQTRRHAAE